MLAATSGRYNNTVNFDRDAASNLTNESITLHGQTFSFTAQYNANSQLTKLTLPDGTVIDRDYDLRRLLTQLKHNGAVIDTRTYDAASRLATSAYGNGVSTSFIHRADGLVSQINSTTPASTPVGDLSYQWDANKNKTSETITGPLSCYGFDQTSYDADDRLISWQRSDNNLDQSWNLSGVGDWNTFTENSAIQSRTHNAVHEITTVTPPTSASQTVTHDNKGNTTLIPPALRTPNSSAANLPLSLSWDFDNYLRSATVNGTPPTPSQTVQFEYDALKRRVSRTNSTGTILFISFGQQVFADYTVPSSGTVNPATPDFTYVYASYIDEIIFRAGSAGPRYFHRNQQYSVIALTGGGGTITERYAYDAYGTPTITDASGTARTTSADNNRYTYTGREFDSEFGLYHYRARMYDSVAGRFCSRDPIGFTDGLHTYAYVHNDPTSAADPSGLKGCAAVRYTTAVPVYRKSLWKFSFEVDGEDVFEGRECSINCDDCTEGITISGTYTKRLKIKLAVPIGLISFGVVSIPIKLFGSGEGGGKISTTWNSCTGIEKKSGCGYYRFSGGLEGCFEDPAGIFKACAKGEVYYSNKWCLDGTNDSCTGIRGSVKFCNVWPWRRCREYILTDINNCSGGGSGEG